MSKTCLHISFFAIILTLFVLNLNANPKSHYILIQLINDLNFNVPAKDYPGYKSAVLPAAKPAAKHYRSAVMKGTYIY